MQNMNPEKIYRTNPLEVLVLPLANILLTQCDNSLGLDTSKPILCRTYRQALQLEELMNQELFPECEMELMEGDLEAVLRELDGCTEAAGVNGGKPAESDYCGLICNASELSALGLKHRIRAIFTQEEMVPAAGMGFEQCVEIGSGFAEIELRAELAFMDRIAQLDGCADSETIAMITSVYAEADEGGLELWALYYDEESGQWWTDWIAGDPGSPEEVGAMFAEQIRGGEQWFDREE